MITIHKSFVIVKNKSEDFMTRLIWKTKLVESLLFAKATTVESNTNRPFIGQLNEEKGTLLLTRVRPLTQHFFPKIIVHLSNVEQDNSLTLKFKLGVSTTIFYIFLIWGAIKLSLVVIKDFSYESLIGYLLWIIIFVGGAMLLTFIEIRKIKGKIYEILNFGFD